MSKRDPFVFLFPIEILPWGCHAKHIDEPMAWKERYGPRGDRSEIVEPPLSGQEKEFLAFMHLDGLFNDFPRDPKPSRTGMDYINENYPSKPHENFWEGLIYLDGMVE